MIRLIAVLTVLFVPSSLEAQVFRRYSNYSTGTTRAMNGHWGFPGITAAQLESHLAGPPHYYKAQPGLSMEQLLSIHDALHEGRPVPSAPKPMPARIQHALPTKVNPPVKREVQFFS